MSVAKHLKQQFEELVVTVCEATKNIHVSNVRVRINLYFSSEEPGHSVAEGNWLCNLDKCETAEGILLYLIRANLIGYLNYKLIEVFVKASGNDPVLKSFFEAYEKEYSKLFQCDFPSLIKVFCNPILTPLPPISLPDFTLRIGKKWEDSSLYSFKEVFERRFSWAQHLLIFDVTPNCILIKYAVLPFFVSAVVEDLSDPEVIAELKQQDITVELSPLLQEMAHLSCAEPRKVYACKIKLMVITWKSTILFPINCLYLLWYGEFFSCKNRRCLEKDPY